MIDASTATLNNVIWTPYRHDRIEVCGKRDNGEAVSFSVPGEFLCEFASGPNLLALANYVGRLMGPGYYGLKSSRKLGFWDTHTRLRAEYDAEAEARRRA